MRYRIYHNPSAHFMRPFADDDIVVTGYEGDIDVPTSPDLASFMQDDLAACEAIYSRHNRDDRPDGQEAPSLSIGDVVMLRAGTSESYAYSVDVCGFVPADFSSVGRVIPGPYARVIESVHRQVLALDAQRDRKFP